MCDDMKGNIKSMIMNQRASASKKIELMKKMHDKSKRSALNDIQEMRVKMAKEAIAASKLGDLKHCKPS